MQVAREETRSYQLESERKDGAAPPGTESLPASVRSSFTPVGRLLFGGYKTGTPLRPNSPFCLAPCRGETGTDCPMSSGLGLAGDRVHAGPALEEPADRRAPLPRTRLP